MEDLLKKYGGLPNLKKHLDFFYQKVCQERGIKHYFFGVNLDNVIKDQVNFRSFVMRKPEHMYRDLPMQIATVAIRVKPNVFEDVMKTLQAQLKIMGVHWKEIPRMSHHIIEIAEETRSAPTDVVKTTIDPALATLDILQKTLAKKGLTSSIKATGELSISVGNSVAYPISLHLSPSAKKLTLIGRGYARQGVEWVEIQKVLDAAMTRFPFFPLEIKKDEDGVFIHSSHTIDYAGAGIPSRMLLNLVKEFSWRYEEVMYQDKDERLINLVRDV
jgi:hypothetical protein